ncbi:MAG: hypothetical protein E6H03_02605 [Bacillati bacterium ANGP1]|uniref:Uncharacterized protein n=1 Tax=Candidatus Segetimicrobium genomatis TaxID=2569760 RepID=A0A537JLU4_9BACT|nr:MAG: hypothetical protein E6H03_02605 [Terrabacteria group bacterium ANGP1]
MTWDEGDGALMVVGGVDFTDTQFLNDVWWLWNASGTSPSTQNWWPISPSGTGPLPRAAHSTVYRHQTQRRATIFAGVTCMPCVGVNDAWVIANIEDQVFDPPFATFAVNNAKIGSGSRSLQVHGRFTLVTGASIGPLTQAVDFGFGGYATTSRLPVSKASQVRRARGAATGSRSRPRGPTCLRAIRSQST